MALHLVMVIVVVMGHVLLIHFRLLHLGMFALSLWIAYLLRFDFVIPRIEFPLALV